MGHVSHQFFVGVVAVFLVGLAACGTEESGPAPDSGHDAGLDASSDATTSLPEPAVHRSVAVRCDDDRPYFDIPPEASGWGAPMGCTTHEECTEGENGRCTGNSHDGWRCTYDSCFEDTDCGTTVCACDGGWRSGANACLGGNCQVDADCGAGGWCSPSMGECGLYGGVTGYWCHTPEDTCTNDTDCPGTGDFGGPGYCMFSQTLGHWQCSYSQCAG